MFVKAVLVLCAQALLVKSVLNQCIGGSAIGPFGRSGPGLSPLTGPGVAYDGLAGRSLAGERIYSPALEFTATSGGSLPVTSTSAIAPTGISIVSENVFEGALSVAGELPFVGTTGMEGAMPSAGAGAINHSCGDGVTAMVSEAAVAPAAALAPAAAVAPSAGFGIGAGLGRATGFAPVGLSASGFGLSNRLGFGGCGRGVLY